MAHKMREPYGQHIRMNFKCQPPKHSISPTAHLSLNSSWSDHFRRPWSWCFYLCNLSVLNANYKCKWILIVCWNPLNLRGLLLGRTTDETPFQRSSTIVCWSGLRLLRQRLPLPSKSVERNSFFRSVDDNRQPEPNALLPTAKMRT